MESPPCIATGSIEPGCELFVPLIWVRERFATVFHVQYASSSGFGEQKLLNFGRAKVI